MATFAGESPRLPPQPGPAISSWLSPLYRVLAFTFLCWRLAATITIPGPDDPSAYSLLDSSGTVIEWNAVRGVLDLVFVFLAARYWEAVWVLPMTGGWIVFSLIAQEGPWCSSITTFQETLPYLVTALAVSFALVRLFRVVGLRGRILLVCLLTAAIPLAFLTVAMFRQTDRLVSEYLEPIGEQQIAREVWRIDRRLSAEIGTALRILLKITPQTRAIPPLRAESLFAESESLGIPLISVGSAPAEAAVSVDFEAVSLESLARYIARFQGLDLVCTSKRAASIPITIHAKEIAIDELLERLNRNREVSLSFDDRALYVVDRENASGTASPLAISYHTSAVKSGGGRPEALPLCHLRIRNENGRKVLKVEMAARDGSDMGDVAGRQPQNLRIDLDAWIQHLLPRIQSIGEPRQSQLPIAIFPAEGKMLSSVFQGFETRLDQSRRPLEWDLNFSPADAGPAGIPWLAGDTDPPKLHAGRDGVRIRGLSPVFRRIFSPTGERWLLETWFLPSVRATVVMALPGRAIVRQFAPQQERTLLMGILMMVVAGVMSILYSDRLGRPLMAITEAARRIKDGDLRSGIPIEPDQAEVSELGETLALMAEKLTGRIEVANRRLAEEKVRFETLIESTWEGIFLIGPEGRIGYANHAGRQLLGERENGACFCEAFQGLGTDFQPPLPQALDPVLSEFKTIFTVPMKQAAGPRVYSLYLRACHMEDPIGSPQAQGFIAVCRDITVEKEIDRMKTDFVSQVSHELRTPLTSIQAYTEMLMDGEVETQDQQRDYLKIIFDESERLTRLINDLLDIARIESGRRVIKPVPLDLTAVARNIAEVLKGMAEGKGIRIDLALPGQPRRILGDADLIKQAGLNLLSNAIKYTPEGGRVEISIVTEADGRVAWAFRDTGIGLTPKEKDRLFTKFFRADSETVRLAGGTGLGLVLVKQIVEAHQAEIAVASVYGQGSTFTLRFRPLVEG